uniref:DSBA domain-containing protein n=1 Tax=Angiostrongylus cantonensis TaxID=6313 RepID=A0A158PB53_ANGCA
MKTLSFSTVHLIVWDNVRLICALLQSLLRYQNIWPIQVNLKPFSLGTIMRSSGNKPPGLLPSKSLYMLKDLQRNNDFWKMELSPPEDFMKWIKTETSDNAMKLLLVIQKEQPQELETTSREFWKRIWMEGKPIFRREDFEKVVSMLYIWKTPWIVVHKDGEEHAFFGSDRLHLIGHLIGHEFSGGLTQFAKL